jgi:hypothetical protein
MPAVSARASRVSIRSVTPLKAILLGPPQVENQNVRAKLLVKPARFLSLASLADHIEVVLQRQHGPQWLVNHRMIIVKQDL